MVEAIHTETGVSYEWGANYFPSDPGTGPDWAYGALGVVSSMTIELRYAQNFRISPPRSNEMRLTCYKSCSL
jgi:hypothetical protein